MRDAAGTAAADPRYPDVKAKLQEWNGDVEVMATLQLAIEPSSACCDAFISAICRAVYKRLKTDDVAPVAGSALPIHYCESFPNIFESMKGK